MKIIFLILLMAMVAGCLAPAEYDWSDARVTNIRLVNPSRNFFFRVFTLDDGREIVCSSNGTANVHIGSRLGQGKPALMFSPYTTLEGIPPHIGHLADCR